MSRDAVMGTGGFILARGIFCALLGCGIALVGAETAKAAQADAKKPAAAAPAAPAAPVAKAPGKPDDKKEDPMAVKTFEVTTTDRVRIKFDFYPGAGGKETVPVVLLHGFKGSRADFKGLAPKLQAQGHAVIIPDLRGHGESVMRVQIDPRTKAEKVVKDPKLSPEKLSAAELVNMAKRDMNAVAKWIQERNNKNEMNARKLCIVGADTGALVGLTWAAVVDWSWENYGPFAQGKDTQAFVLLSPPTQYKGLKSEDLFMARPALCSEASFLIVVGGKEQAEQKAAKLLHGKLSRYHKAPPKTNGASGTDKETKKPAATATKAGAKKDEPAEVPSLMIKEVSTSFQGTKLLSNPKLDVKVDQEIIDFIDARVAQKKVDWVKHMPPLD